MSNESPPESTGFSTAENDRLVNSLFRSRAVGIALADREGKLLKVNRRWAELSRVQPENAGGVKILDLVSNKDKKIVADWWNEIADSAENHSHTECRILRSDGSEILVKITADSSEWKDRLLLFLDDISEKNEIEKALKRSEERFLNLFDLASDGIFLTDMKGRIENCNFMACEMFYRTWESMRGILLDDILYKDDDNAGDYPVIENLSSWGDVVELVGRRSEGVVFPVEVNGVLITEKRVPRMWVFARDISERKLQERKNLELAERMQQAERLESLGVLAGGIAHDFNNLLGAITGHVELGLLEESLDSKTKGVLRKIGTISTRAANLTTQLLAYSGQGNYVIQEHDLSKIVRATVEMKHVAPPDNCKIEVNLAENLPLVKGDHIQLQQVVINLLSNALEALGNNEGTISMETGVKEVDEHFLSRAFTGEATRPGTFVYFKISDDGHGMDRKTLKRAFEPFFSTRFVGRGLGLPAVLGIAKAHLGAVTVESKSGKGTTIRVLFPVVDYPESGKTSGISNTSARGNNPADIPIKEKSSTGDPAGSKKDGEMKHRSAKTKKNNN